MSKLKKFKPLGYKTRSQKRFGTSYRSIKIRAGESRHHRRPRSRGGTNHPDNISVVKQTDHDHCHALFSNHTPETICAIVNEKWLDKRYRFVCERII